MIRSNGNAASAVQPWLAVTLLAGVGAYAIGTTPPPQATSPAKLQPPSGFIGGTMKTLDEIEPRTPLSDRFLVPQAGARFTITEPGSYYLPDDVAVGANLIGIKILAAPVTIDLMGHTIDGGNSSDDLIWIDGLADRVVIKNGTLRRSGSRGIDSVADTILIEMIEVVETKNAGVALNTGRAATLRDVSIADTGTAGGWDGVGLRLSGPGKVRASDMEITNTYKEGVYSAPESRLTLSDTYIGSTGAEGIEAHTRAEIKRVRVENSTGDGVWLGSDCVFIDSHVDDVNGGDGVQAGDRCVVQNNRIYVNNGQGAAFGAGVMIIGNDAVVKRNTVVGGGSAFFGIRLDGDRNLLSCNRNYDNAGFSLSTGNLVGNILTSVSAFNSNQDPDANFDN